MRRYTNADWKSSVRTGGTAMLAAYTDNENLFGVSIGRDSDVDSFLVGARNLSGFVTVGVGSPLLRTELIAPVAFFSVTPSYVPVSIEIITWNKHDSFQDAPSIRAPRRFFASGNGTTPTTVVIPTIGRKRGAITVYNTGGNAFTIQKYGDVFCESPAPIAAFGSDGRYSNSALNVPVGKAQMISAITSAQSNAGDNGGPVFPADFCVVVISSGFGDPAYSYEIDSVVYD